MKNTWLNSIDTGYLVWLQCHLKFPVTIFAGYETVF